MMLRLSVCLPCLVAGVFRMGWKLPPPRFNSMKPLNIVFTKVPFVCALLSTFVSSARAVLKAFNIVYGFTYQYIVKSGRKDTHTRTIRLDRVSLGLELGGPFLFRVSSPFWGIPP